MATQTKIHKYACKRTLPTGKKVQLKISTFFKRTKEIEDNEDVICISRKLLCFSPV